MLAPNWLKLEFYDAYAGVRPLVASDDDPSVVMLAVVLFYSTMRNVMD